MNDVLPTILLTRPAQDAVAFGEQLRDSGEDFQLEISPVLQLIPKKKPVDLSDASGVIFTSRNAVHAVSGRPMVAWCVGSATANAAAGKGWHVKVADGDVETLYARILADAPEGQLVHLRGAVARGNLAARLNVAGISTRDAVVYEQVVLPLSDAAKAMLAREKTVIVPLFSPKSAAQFASHGPFEAAIHVVAISKATAVALGDMPRARVVMATKKDAKSMCEAVLKLLSSV